MSELVLDTNPIEVEKATSTEVASSSTAIVPVKQDSIVEGLQKEYSVVGDGLYASVSAEEAPQWLTGILDNVISARLDASLTSLQQANLNIVNSLSELEIAKNQYQELINIDATIDSVVTSRLTTLNATVDQNTASIMGLDTNKVTETEAISIAGNVVQASLDSGAINARVGSVETALTNTNAALASTTTALEAQFDDVAAVTSTLENSIIATADKAEANFAYNATVTLNNTNYSTGFGLATSLVDAGIPVGSSEFWVRSDNVKFVDTLNNTVLKGDAQGLTFPSAGSIKSEGYNLDTNDGVFMGYNPSSLTYELMAGNTTEYLKWNGSSLSVKGGITATSISVPNGSIGTAAIGDAAITNAKIEDAAITNAKISGVIQSSTFSTVNKTGWQLNKDGDGIFYGTVYAQSLEGDVIKNVGIYTSYTNLVQLGSGLWHTTTYTLPRNLRGAHMPAVEVSCSFTRAGTINEVKGLLRVRCNGVTRTAETGYEGGNVSVSLTTPATTTDVVVYVDVNINSPDVTSIPSVEVTGYAMGLS